MPEIPRTYAMLVHPEYGYESDKENAKALSINIFYKVTRISMGQSHTNVKLKGQTALFNSVQFDFFDYKKQPINIYDMPEYNHYLQTIGEQTND